MHKTELRDKAIFVISEFLTPEDCRELIEWSEYRGFADAPISTTDGEVMEKSIRNNSRIVVDDPEMAAKLFQKAEPLLLPTWFQRSLIGLNERLRFYRYEPGQRFAPHFDGRFARENGERSEFSFLVYLNEDFEGGATRFLGEHPVEVQPVTGMALVFHHPQLHEGAEIHRGVKYVLRSDVMYSALPNNAE